MGASQRGPMESIYIYIVLLGGKLKFVLWEVSGRVPITSDAVMTSVFLVNSCAQISNFQYNFCPSLI